MKNDASCLVTGGTGFIGRFVVRALLARGTQVRLLCRNPAKARQLFGDEVDVYVGDLLQPAVLAPACRNIDSVIHVAGVYSFGRRGARLAELTNVGGTDALLQAAWTARVERFTQISSSGVLFNQHGPITERDFPDEVSARHSYRHSKWLSELAALRWAVRGFPVSVASPTCPIGPEDESPTPTGRMIVDFLRRRCPFAAPTLLNFLDVGELAGGILAVADRGRSGERYILGNENLWHAEFLQLLGRLTGRPAPRTTLPWWIIGLIGAVGELAADDRICSETAAHCRKRQVFDTTKARSELDWFPQIPLAVSARAAIDWYERQLHPALVAVKPDVLKTGSAVTQITR